MECWWILGAVGNANLEAGNTEFRASTERGERDEEREVRYRD